MDKDGFSYETNLYGFKDRFRLYDVLALHVDFFASTKMERRAFLYILSRTIEYGRVEERIPTRFFRAGCEAHLFCCPKADMNKVGQALRSLAKRGVLLKRVNRRSHDDIGWITKIRLNILGMLDVLFEMQVHSTTLWHELQAIAKRLEAIWSERGWERRRVTASSDCMAKLNECIRDGRRKSEEAMKRKIDKAGAAGRIMAVMRDEVAGYHESWTGKLKGMAKNWLAECDAQKRDWEAHIRAVCQNWPLFQKALRRDDGSEILLRPRPNFEQYYQYRRDVDVFLAEPENLEVKKVANLIEGEWDEA